MRSRSLNFDFIHLTRLPYLMVVIFTPLVSFGDECIEGDCVNGRGTMVFSTGHKYTGEFMDGERNGRGTLVYPDGRALEGEFLKK